MRAELTIKKRLLMMLAVLTLLFCLVGVRIGSLTLFQGNAWVFCPAATGTKPR